MINKSVIKICLIVFIILLSFSGCKKINEKQYITIEPSSLFKGDTKALQNHLDFIGTGAVKIKGKQSNMLVKTKYELWENGKLISSSDCISTVIKDKLNNEVTISLKKDIQNPEMFSVNIGITDDDGYSGGTFPVKGLADGFSYGVTQIREEHKMIEGKEERIWLLGATKGDMISFSDDIEENAKSVDWALIIKVVVESKDIKK